jgi:hypothetical protein
LFALMVLATAGPLLALALVEATRIVGDRFADRLFPGILIATAVLAVLGALVSPLMIRNRYRRRRPQFRRTMAKRGPSPIDIELDLAAADVDLESRQAEYDLQNFPPAPRTERRPKEFTERLAGYLHCPTEELAGPRPVAPSKMSFWSRVGQLRWFGPKPAYLVRRLLERIREQVRGGAH